MKNSGLRIYNSATREKEDFVPLRPPEVKMYVCGPTVYNFLHVGNFRGPVFFNLVRNWLENEHGYKVTYALNFTDIDDRIIQRANEEKVSSEEISERYIAEYQADFKSLGLTPHECNPKVTETLPEITDLVSRLLEKNRAYSADGDVMFSINDFPSYGHLSGRNPEDMMAGARVEIDGKKKNPLDFVLWKGAKPGEPSWPSPWGEGRPGWHIECSAMVFKHLGEQIDIHGGGLDLVFPHHENEIAQSEGASEKKFAKTWMHVNMLNLSGQKMSKSLGNFVTLREFLTSFPAEVYKWMILSVHYRSVCDFGDEAVHRAISGLARVYSALSLAESFGAVFGSETSQNSPLTDSGFESLTAEAWKKVQLSLNDDFNTPECFAALFDVVRVLNSQLRRGAKVTPQLQGKAQSFVNFVRRLGEPMALFQERPHDFLQNLDSLLLKHKNIERSEVESLVAQRSEARARKDFAASDELRDRLTALGISISDTSTGVHWEVTK